MAKGKPGVMIYFETAKAVKGLDYEIKGRLFEAIMEYAEFGVVPEFDGILAAVWPFVADKVERDTAYYAKKVEQRRRAQYSRWWKKYAKENGIDPDDEFLREQWIDIQMNTNVSDALQMIPTSTTTPATTRTRTTSEAESPSTIIRDKGEGERDNGLTSQPDIESFHDSSEEMTYSEFLEFEELRRHRIKLLEQNG